jgi:hypothetical protein
MGKWAVITEKGKNLGTFNSEREADEAYRKHKNKKKGRFRIA